MGSLGPPRDNSSLALGIGAIASFGISCFCGSLFRRANEKSKLLRITKKVNVAGVQEGQYVMLQGCLVPKDEEGSLISPESQQPCVMYKMTKIRVVEELSAVKKSKTGQKKGTGTKNVAGDRTTCVGEERKEEKVENYSDQAVEQNDWKVKHEVMENNTEKTAMCLKDNTGSIAIETAGAQYFYGAGWGTSERFIAEKEELKRGQTRRALGIKILEEVLPVGQKVLVFGEVQNSDDDDAPLVVRRAAARSMFDRRTGIAKPFIVTCFGRTELLAQVEQSGVALAWTGGIFFLIGVGCTYFGLAGQSQHRIDRSPTPLFF